MTRKTKVSELAEFDPSRYLDDDDEAIADYIRLAIEDGDPGLLAAALGDVARARGMTQVAQAAGLTREALYKALRPEAWLGASTRGVGRDNLTALFSRANNTGSLRAAGRRALCRREAEPAGRSCSRPLRHAGHARHKQSPGSPCSAALEDQAENPNQVNALPEVIWRPEELNKVIWRRERLPSAIFQPVARRRMESVLPNIPIGEHGEHLRQAVSGRIMQSR